MKKKIPLEILKSLETVVLRKKEYYKLVKSDNNLLELKDTDENSDFYFNVIEHKFNNGKLIFHIDRKPTSSKSSLNNKLWINSNEVESYVSSWETILEGYEKVKTIYDDLLLEKYKTEFEQEYQILDNDSETSSFELKQQIFLDNYLEKVLVKLENYKDENNEIEIAEIIYEVKNLREEQTQLTKNQVIKRLSLVWAKARKVGLQLLKEIYIEAKKEIIKTIVKAIIEQ